jgi:hypothetical protein
MSSHTAIRSRQGLVFQLAGAMPLAAKLAAAAHVGVANNRALIDQCQRAARKAGEYAAAP